MAKATDLLRIEIFKKNGGSIGEMRGSQSMVDYLRSCGYIVRVIS